MTDQKDYEPKPFTIWLTLGQANPWIKMASGPPFNANSFHLCKCEDELLEKLCGDQSWCLGQAFVLGNLCFIQQVDGGDEWLVIRGHIAFESFSCRVIGREKLIGLLARFRKATPDQLKTLSY